MARAMETHFKAKESRNASKCREMLKHTRAMKTHFGANEQTQALNSFENGLKHTLRGM